MPRVPNLTADQSEENCSKEGGPQQHDVHRPTPSLETGSGNSLFLSMPRNGGCDLRKTPEASDGIQELALEQRLLCQPYKHRLSN